MNKNEGVLKLKMGRWLFWGPVSLVLCNHKVWS